MIKFFRQITYATLILTLASCSQKADSDSQDAPKDHQTQTLAEAVESGLSDSAWVALGVPDPSRTWDGNDMATAYLTINKEYRNGSGYLPTMHKDGGSQTFIRIISPRNLEILKADSLDTSEKLMEGTQLVQPLTQIYMLYLTASQKDGMYKEELIDMMIALISTEEKFLMVVRDFVSEATPEQRESESFTLGISQIQSGVTQSLSGVIRVLRDKGTFTQAQLEKLASGLRRDGPELVSQLDDENRSMLELEAAKTLMETDNPVIGSALRKLFPFVEKRLDSLKAVQE